MKDKNKTVYVLGAGFSKEAKAPSQEEIVSKIFEMNKNGLSFFEPKKFNKFKSFLSDTLHIPSNLQETIPLEDIFTPLDRCLLDNISFRNLDVEGIREMRGILYELIGRTLEKLLTPSDKTYIDVFARHIVAASSKRQGGNYKREDPVSVITTNWDILLDNSIYSEIQKRGELAVVDYCCYISSYDKEDHSIKPGLEILGQGGYNAKLLKLHGSLNWLQCPRCHRLYVKFNEKIAMNPFRDEEKPKCRHCEDNFGNHDSHSLVSNIIMPTFLKDLTNPQYKIIWQNAGVELAEAKKIVFIGYSLPQADFEMRQLLSRMVDERTEIEVVDFRKKKDKEGKEILKDENYEALINRYRQFFGKEVKSFDNGAADYVLSQFGS